MRISDWSSDVCSSDLPAGTLHKSLGLGWMPLEIIPKPVKYREWRRRALLGVYFPVAEPRPVYEGAVVDGAVNERRKRDSGYEPVNLRDAPLPRRQRPSHNIASPPPGHENGGAPGREKEGQNGQI